MLRKSGLQVLVLGLILSFSRADLMAQKRISFRRGASSATVRGQIGGNGYLEYLINGREGQVMSIEITSGNGAVVVNAWHCEREEF
jgi:hypothetical protein